MDYFLHFLWLFVVSLWAFYLGMHFTLYLLRKKFLNFYFETMRFMPVITRKLKCDYLYGLLKTGIELKVITSEEGKDLYFLGFYYFHDLGEDYAKLYEKLKPLLKEGGWLNDKEGQSSN